MLTALDLQVTVETVSRTILALKKRKQVPHLYQCEMMNLLWEKSYFSINKYCGLVYTIIHDGSQVYNVAAECSWGSMPWPAVISAFDVHWRDRLSPKGVLDCGHFIPVDSCVAEGGSANSCLLASIWYFVALLMKCWILVNC